MAPTSYPAQENDGNLSAILTELQLKADLTETQPVSIASVPSHAVTGPLTDTELRATAVPISAASLPLPTSAATQATLASVLTELQLKADLTETQPVSTKTALTAASPTAATVGVASAEALATNANRRGLVLVNTSDNTISLGIGAAAVLNSGITLQPGAIWTMNEYTFSTGAINAIASAAGSNLSIQEWT